VHVITLTTDFGTADWFVGTMKGVIAGIAPGATVVDVTHGIPRGDLRAGAFALAASCRFFPKHTIHVAVVDPGVGSARAAIAVQTASALFVGPDNGVLSWALRGEKIKTIRRLENEQYFFHPVSRTFHGRDVFAPVAAHLSRGVNIRRLGPPADDFIRLPWPEPIRETHQVRGEVVHVDRFGNAITNLTADEVRGRSAAAPVVVVRGKSLCAVAAFYQAVRRGQPVAVVGSSGFLEIAVNGGNAAKRLALRVGTPVVVRCGRVAR
jgi:hypothetical protein